MTGTAADGDRTVVQAYDPLIGTLLDERFRIDFLIAAGGFGAIYRATDVRSDAEVALKVLHPTLTGDPNVVERFRREGQMLARLRDPHTITAYELGEAPDGTLFIVMELLHGVSLYERFRTQGRLPWRRVLHIVRGVCSSLAEAHALGIVHRDLKPANVHLELRGNDPDFAKVLDFGIAKRVDSVDTAGGVVQRVELTAAGQMIGTVDYMSPEQMVGGEMTPQSDIYSLGILMYEMISGRTPFAEAQTPTAILAAVLTQVPAPLSAYVDVPPALDHVVARCLAREARSRFAEIGALVDALAAVTTEVAAQPAGWSADTEATELPTVPVVSSAPAPALGETSGFEEAVLTSDATRIDVRLTNSSEPVLDARGPRVRPEALAAALRPPPIPPSAMPPPFPAHELHARGPQHELDPRLAYGTPPTPPPRGYFAPPPDGAPMARPSDEQLAARKRDLMLRRIIWWFVLFLVSTVITVLATR